VYYFFDNFCESCHPENQFPDEFRALTGKPLADYQFIYRNMAHASNRPFFDQVLDELTIPDDMRLLPMIVVDGQVYAGTRSIQSDLPRSFMESSSDTDSAIYYLYAPACESCVQAEQAISEIPNPLTVTRGQYSFESALSVRKINIYDDPGAAQALFERYQVPEAKRVTPIIFAGDRYYSGISSINFALRIDLPAGLAIGTPLLAEQTRPATFTGGWAETALAGLVAGLNPCALSMLLFLLALMSGANLPLKPLILLFLSAKFITYLAIGLLFAQLLSALNLSRLPLFAKLILTILCGLLIIANIRDAYLATQERYGEIKNQLPIPLRRFLHQRIDKSLNASNRWLAASICLLGMIVASGEFLCAGQLYLASLIAQVHSGGAGGRMIPLLIVFSAMFLMPSVALSALVIRGRRVFDLSERVRGHMPLIKIGTAVLMAGICVWVWVG